MSVIERLNQKLITGTTNKSGPEALTREIGGYNRNNQPYISGYFQVFFSLPQKLFSNNGDLAASWLHSTCEGFTPPTQTINKIDVVGQGQVGASFISSVTTTREYTLTFREYQNQPILNIIRTWSALFDPHLGVSPLSGEEFIPLNYKGRCYVGQMKPTMGKSDEGEASQFSVTDFEEIYAFDGVFPTTIPFDTAGASDIATNDSVQHSITFSFDGFPITLSDGDNKLVDEFKKLLGNRKYMSTYTHFTKALLGE